MTGFCNFQGGISETTILYLNLRRCKKMLCHNIERCEVWIAWESFFYQLSLITADIG